MRMKVHLCLLGSLAWLATAVLPGSSRADVTLVQDGAAKAAIFVSADVMAPNAKTIPPAWTAKEQESQRQRLRESVNDLALYLGKISGAEVAVVLHAPEPGEARLPILIGDLAAQKFGPPKATALYKQAFRVVVSEAGIGLSGESDLAASYAIYQLLERLGCRWYMPGEWGEVVPVKKTIAVPLSDESLAPSTISRVIWFTDEAFRRRTRQGGLHVAATHALEISNFISKDQLLAHPEWCGLINGKRTPGRFCWANPEAAAALADGIVARLDKAYMPTVSLSPNDGSSFCQCEQCKALDAGDWDPSIGTVSITDRYVHFCNQIAERVTKKYPDVVFGFLAYVQYTRPPVRETLHPNLVPEIAPITYCRAHTALQTDICPSRHMIREIVEGWGKKARHVSYYNYMFHLAEVSVPYPMMRQMSDELPLVYANNVSYWQPETMSNFESVLPGMVLTVRMAWDPKAKPAAVLDEFFTGFYGAAAGPMRQYWQLFDDAWTTVPEHAGCGFGHARRFTPEMLKQARTMMDEALSACRTDNERHRVTLQDEALKQFELFMKLRRDLFAGRFAAIGAESTQWLDRHAALGKEYAAQYAFDSHGGIYFKMFFEPAYQDAARIAKDYAVVVPPLRQWRYRADKEKQGESLGWQRPEFDDQTWPTTDPCVDTWSALGFDSYFGPMVYRASVKVPALSAGKKAYLWISCTDASAKVFINGRHIPYVNAKGQTADEFSGFGEPASFEITAAIQSNAENQVTIVGTRTFLNELGTGGLLGPVVIYHDK